MSNFKVTLATFLVTLALLALGAIAADWIHPRLACASGEKEFWNAHTQPHRFERVSSLFWSSLCASKTHPLIVSASEGTGEFSFPEAGAMFGYQLNEFTGAHRGLKTAAYMLANDIHPDRLAKLKMIVLINPVYFSFAASTDSSSLRLTAISNWSYFLRIRSFHQKWDEFLAESPWIGLKSYVQELQAFESIKPAIFDHSGEIVRERTADYDFDRNMLKSKTAEFTSFRSPFTSTRQPARYLFDSLVSFANAHPNAKICYVMLPTNTKNLRHFGREADQIQKEMSELMTRIPEKSRLDLQVMNEADFIFLDPMHLTDVGKFKVMEAIVRSECGRKVLNAP